MVSKKKKGRGKAKKTAKKTEEKQEAANEQQGAPDAQMQQLTINKEGAADGQGTPGAPMQRLKINEYSQDEDALLEEAIKLAAAEKEALEAAAKHGNGCDHGYVTTENHRIMDFSNAFLSGFLSADGHILKRLGPTVEATVEKYPDVLGDPSKLKQVVNFFIFIGTQKVLNGDIARARMSASFAFYFEEYIAIHLDKRKATMDATKMIELSRADENTLVKYLRKNIPCNCLDEKYKEVKSVTKMGFCCNDHCQVPGRMVERRTMLYCTRCRGVNYCSPECQKAHWPSHKEMCDEFVIKES